MGALRGVRRAGHKEWHNEVAGAPGAAGLQEDRLVSLSDARETADSRRIRSLEQRVAALEEAQKESTGYERWIHTFAPEPITLRKPIPILVRPHEGEYLASFLDANINISGETEAEAFSSIKTLILDVWEKLHKLATTSKLGPRLADQLAVLREFIDGPA
jgi:hypothetical protein